MKRENISVEEVRRLLHYNPLTGIFTRRVTTGGRYGGKAGAVAGTLKDGYVQISLHSVQYRAHRLAWLYMTGAWPQFEVDHRNTVRADNTWDNLREAPGSLNAENKRKAQSNSKTGILGVCWIERDKTFCSRIMIDGKYTTLGYSKDDPMSLQQKYLTAKRQHHAGCTI